MSLLFKLIFEMISTEELFPSVRTSNARLKTRSALSRRNDISKLRPNYLFIQFYSSANPYQKIFFCEKRSPLCKKMNPKKNLKNKKCFFDPGSVFL